MGSTSKLHYNSWKSNTIETKKIMILVHGLGDYSGHMLTIVQHFGKIGYVLYGHDQVGHGDTSGERGVVNRWSILQEDLKRFYEFVIEKEGNKLPVVLFGNSLGGEVVLSYIMEYPNDGISAAIVNAPALSLSDVNFFSGIFIDIMGWMLPKMTLNAELDSSKLTRDEEKQNENTNDILIHTSASFGLLSEMRKKASWILSHPENIKLPTLLLQGEKDPIVRPEVNINFFKTVKKTNPKVNWYEMKGGRHETFNEIDRDTIFSEMTNFLQD